MAVSLRRPCRCGHGKDAHQHYRSGADCGSCACERFRGRFEITVRRVRSVVTPEVIPVPREPYVRPAHGGVVAHDLLDVAVPVQADPEHRLSDRRAG